MFVRRSAPDPSARRLAVHAVALGLFSIAFSAAASDEAGRRLNLASALAVAEAKGFDALLAEAAVAGAAGDAETTRRLRNPAFSGTYLRSTSVPVPGGETTSSGYALAAGDQGALEGVASGKHALRVRGAVSALAAARFNREEALRILRRETALAFFGALLAEASERVRREVAQSYAQTFELADLRLRYGAASRADRARIETAKLEADQGATAAAGEVARARAALGFWLGGEDLDGVVLEGGLEAGVPAWLASADLAALRAEAAGRPDVRAASADLERAEAALDLARRQRLPDMAFAASYGRQGPDVAPVTPPTLSFGASFELPVFSQRQGEIARAESDRRAAHIALARAEARAEADLRSAWASLRAAREQVERMQTALLARAREARELVRYQYREGAVSLLDLLDAERTALEVELENVQDLCAQRVAVVELETAAGRAVTP